MIEESRQIVNFWTLMATMDKSPEFWNYESCQATTPCTNESVFYKRGIGYRCREHI